MANVGRPTMFDNPKTVTVIIEQSVYDVLSQISSRSRVSVSEIIRRAIDRYMAQMEPGDGHDLRDIVAGYLMGQILAEEAMEAIAAHRETLGAAG